MQSRNRVLDDLARLASGALGTAGGLRSELDQLVQDRLRRILDELDLVRRGEFEAVRDMARLAREEQIALRAEIDALKAKVDALENGPADPDGKESTDSSVG